jgi:hypothetical protein
MGYLCAAGERVMHLQGAAEVDTVERAHGQQRGKGANHAAREFKADWFKYFFAEAAPDVVKVATDDDRCLPLGVGDQVMREKLAELVSPFGSRETQVQVGHDQRAGMFAHRHLAACKERLPALLKTHGEVVAFDIGEREAAENRVAIPTFLDVHVPLKCEVREAEAGGQEFGLHVVPRARHAFVDFLQEGDVGLNMGQRFDDPFGSISAIPAADALVDVVSHESQMHAAMISPWMQLRLAVGMRWAVMLAATCCAATRSGDL